MQARKSLDSPSQDRPSQLIIDKVLQKIGRLSRRQITSLFAFALLAVTFIKPDVNKILIDDIDTTSPGTGTSILLSNSTPRVRKTENEVISYGDAVALTSFDANNEASYSESSTDEMATTSSSDPVHGLIKEVITKWNLTISTNAHNFLQRIWLKEDDSYDPENDLVVFFHPLKSGGTSLSDVLDQLGDKVPGSHASGHFGYPKFDEVYKEEVESGHMSSKDWWDSKKVLYSHHYYRGYNDPPAPAPPASRLGRLLHQKRCTKRIRYVTMVREPVAFAASNFNEWFCHISRWVKAADKQNLPRPQNTTPCTGYTLEDQTKARIVLIRQMCQNKSQAEVDALQGSDKDHCISFQKGQADSRPECASIPAFFASTPFEHYFHHKTKGFTNHTEGTTELDWTDGALDFLGGVDKNVGDGDMIWFGITERMPESMCLFHYQFQIPWITTPTKRFQDCRPTRFWTDEHRAQFRKLQPLDYTVHRVANAILDLKTYKMRQELWSQIIQQNKTLASMPFTTEDCLGPRPSSLPELKALR